MKVFKSHPFIPTTSDTDTVYNLFLLYQKTLRLTTFRDQNQVLLNCLGSLELDSSPGGQGYHHVSYCAHILSPPCRLSMWDQFKFTCWGWAVRSSLPNHALVTSWLCPLSTSALLATPTIEAGPTILLSVVPLTFWGQCCLLGFGNK